MNKEDKVIYQELYEKLLEYHPRARKSSFLSDFVDELIGLIESDKNLSWVTKANMYSMIARYFFNHCCPDVANVYRDLAQVYKDKQQLIVREAEEKLKRKQTYDVLYTLNVKHQKPRPNTLKKYNIIYDDILNMYRQAKQEPDNERSIEK